jgi:putative peptidoglycan lipid II flippase
MLPTLSRQAANHSMEEFSRTIDWALKLVVLIALPAAIGLVLLASPLLVTLFYGGIFSRLDVDMAAISLQAFALGLVGFSFVKILAPAFFAREDTRTPVRYGLIALAINFVLSVLLAWYLTRIEYAASHAGLALATSVAAIANAWLLYRGLRRERTLTHTAGWGLLMLRVLVANAAMSAAILWLQRPVDWWFDASTFDRSLQLGIVVAAGATVYFVTLVVLGLRLSQFRLSGPS